MAKLKRVFVCQECGYESVRWMGKCPSCNEWNTMVEEIEQPADKRSQGLAQGAAGLSRPVSLEEVSLLEEHRESTGLEELDRVLGGGVVKGSLILIGGDPGIGKSTLILQICESLGKEGIQYSMPPGGIRPPDKDAGQQAGGILQKPSPGGRDQHRRYSGPCGE